MNNNETVAAYYEAHRGELAKFVAARNIGSMEAEDIVHDAFVRMLTSDRMITPATLPCLMHTVLRHLIADRFRHKAVENEYEHYIGGRAAAAASAESVYSAREITARMEHCLARLPENCRETYRLHIYGGMKAAEISSATGVGYRSVEHRLGIARKSVRKYLQVYCASAR